MEIDAGDGWEDESRYTDADMDDEDVSEWGLTDGESSNMSEDMDDAAIESEDRGAGAGTWSRHGTVYTSLRLMIIASLLFSVGIGH